MRCWPDSRPVAYYLLIKVGLRMGYMSHGSGVSIYLDFLGPLAANVNVKVEF